jgi:hypothetical protein
VIDNLSGGRDGVAFASVGHTGDFVFAPANYAVMVHALVHEDADYIRAHALPAFRDYVNASSALLQRAVEPDQRATLVGTPEQCRAFLGRLARREPTRSRA